MVMVQIVQQIGNCFIRVGCGGNTLNSQLGLLSYVTGHSMLLKRKEGAGKRVIKEFRSFKSCCLKQAFSQFAYLEQTFFGATGWTQKDVPSFI